MKKAISLVLVLISLFSTIIPSSAEEVNTLENSSNTIIVSGSLAFPGTSGIAEGSVASENKGDLYVKITVYRQRDTGSWAYVGLTSDTGYGYELTVTLPFTAIEGAHYKVIVYTKVTIDGVTEINSTTVYSTC